MCALALYIYICVLIVLCCSRACVCAQCSIRIFGAHSHFVRVDCAHALLSFVFVSSHIAFDVFFHRLLFLDEKLTRNVIFGHQKQHNDLWWYYCTKYSTTYTHAACEHNQLSSKYHPNVQFVSSPSPYVCSVQLWCLFSLIVSVIRRPLSFSFFLEVGVFPLDRTVRKRYEREINNWNSLLSSSTRSSFANEEK